MECAMGVVETGNRELLLAAMLMARSEFVNAVFPIDTRGAKGADLRVLDNEVAKAAIGTLSATGGTYANPLAMQSVLADVRDWDEEEGRDIIALTSMVPDSSEVTLDRITTLK